ncbi:MAG: hypothetical protein Q7J67_02805 [bacterium]|nr:hypothetical protein [bacterium]
MVNINEQKAIKFYSEVISLYPQEIIDSLWKSKPEFLDSLKSAVYKRDNKEYGVDFSKLKIKFSKPIFDILFLNKTAIEFAKPIGQRLELNNYIYLELKESPLVNLKDEENSDLFPLSKSSLSKRRYCWGYFFINEDSKEDLYYPKEVLPIYIFQLRERLIRNHYVFSVDTDIYINFCSLFKPMKYILKVKKDKETLQEKLLYRLCTDLGLTERKTRTPFKINMPQNINEIYDKATDSLLLSNKKQYNIDSLKFYISAMENLDPSYQFLELYHALESYFYKYFYNYIKGLKELKTKKEFKQIENAKSERGMLKLVIEDISNDFPFIKEEFAKIQNFKKFCEDVINKNDIEPNNWDKDKMANLLSDIIYLIRNNVVHTKEAEKSSVSNLSESEQNTFIEINKLLLFIVQKVFDKNIRW